MRRPREEEVRRLLDRVEEVAEEELDDSYFLVENQPEFDWLNEDRDVFDDGEIPYRREVRDVEDIEKGHVYRVYHGQFDERHPDVDPEDPMVGWENLIYGEWFEVESEEPYEEVTSEGDTVLAVDIRYKRSGERDTLFLDDVGIVPYGEEDGEELYHRYCALQENVLAGEFSNGRGRILTGKALQIMERAIERDLDKGELA